MLSSLLGSAPQILQSCGRQLAYATVVFLVVLALLRILPRASATLRYALWGLVLLRLVLPPDLSAPWGLSNLVQVPSIATVAASTPLEEPGPGAGPIDKRQEISSRPGPRAGHLLLLWLAFATLALLRLLQRRRAHADQLEVPVEDPQILKRLEFGRSRLDIKRPVQLLTGTAAVSPFTLGSLRPKIFVPRALLEPGRSETLDAVLAHELVHIKRWDDLTLMCERVLVSIYFFFPLAHWVAARRSAERETLCDQAVLASGLARTAYAQALLEVVRLNPSGDLTVATFTQPRSTFSMRLRNILNSHGAQTTGRFPTATALLLGVLLLPMAAVPNSLAEPDPPPTEPTQTSTETSHPRLLHPLPEGRLTAQFGPWKHPVRKEKVHHNGIDLAAEEGHEIVAPLDGRVSRARLDALDDDGYGTLLEIDHGKGLTTSYYHLGELRAAAGQKVERGQVIATVGMSGQTTGPHLHFEVRLGGELVDPQELLGK